MVRDVDLEGGDARERPRRRAYLGWVVRKCREVVAEQGGLVGEPVAGHLHAVAGVPGETNHNLVNRLDPARLALGLGTALHASSTRLAGLIAAAVLVTFSPARPVVIGILTARPLHSGDVRGCPSPPEPAVRVLAGGGFRKRPPAELVSRF